MGGKTTSAMSRRWALANPDKVQAYRERRYARVRLQREAALSVATAEIQAQGAKHLSLYPWHLVSPLGIVYSTLGRKLTQLKPGLKPGGYEFVGLHCENTVKYEMVHRLVAMTFIPNPLALPVVNHIDGNKRNNQYLNLEWCTPSHNMQHAYDNGLNRSGPQHYRAKLTEAEVRAIRTAVGTYKSIGEAYGICTQSVLNIKHRYTYANVS